MKDWNTDMPEDERRAMEKRMKKLALYNARYGVGPERLQEMLENLPRPSRWQRIKWWIHDRLS